MIPIGLTTLSLVKPVFHHLADRASQGFQGLESFTNYWLVKAQSQAVFVIMAHGEQAARRQYDALVQHLSIESIAIQAFVQFHPQGQAPLR